MTLVLEAALAAVGAGLYAAGIEPRRLMLRRHRLSWPGLCGGTRPLRVALFSDLHAAWPHMTVRRIEAIVRRVLVERPHIVLIAGDFMCTDTLGAWPLPPETLARALAPLSSFAPTYAVLGNHDWDFDGPRVARALSDAGLRILSNDHARLRFGKAELILAGVEDPVSGKDDLGLALSGIDPEEPVLLLAHSPDVHVTAPPNVRLLAAGHTHGGQIRLPGIGALVTMSRLPKHLAHGLHHDGGRHLLVTSGVGTTGIPVRFACPPELVMLELVPEAEPPTRPTRSAKRTSRQAMRTTSAKAEREVAALSNAS